MKLEKLKTVIWDSEEILMEKILEYAKERNYVIYTATLKEAWRISIAGLSKALIEVIESGNYIPEMGPDDDFTKSEVAEFGIFEARKHRSRGVTLSMFLGLIKYYNQAYIDLVKESNFSLEEKEYFCQYIKRYFDYVELGFITEWVGLSEKQKLQELQESNREMVNEKNKYLTVFESIYDPVILVDKNNNIENLNHKALEVFLNISASGMKYYSNINIDKEFYWLNEELINFINLDEQEILQEKSIQTKTAQRTFLMKFKRMLDVSEKYSGAVIIFNDITERIKIEEELKVQHEKLRFYAFTDPMTGVSNRRTGFMMLEKELVFLDTIGTPFSICFIDIDGLKAVNDTYGHTEGDALINDIVSIIKSSVRDIDLVSRMGGDEFLIILPNCYQFEAEKIVKHISDELKDYDKKGVKPFQHSFSYGIIEVNSDSKMDANDIIKAADEKMYQHKLLKKQQ